MRLDAFEVRTGVDLRELPLAVAAGFDDSVLYLAETGASTGRALSAFDARLLGEGRHARSHPRVERIVGVLGSVPESLVAVEGAFVAVSVGDPTLARITELMVEGKLATPPALHGAALGPLPADLESAPIRFYAPGPFSGEWAAGARGLLGAASAVAAAGRFAGDSLRVHTIVTGRFREEDRRRVEGAWADLAGSPVGHLLGLDRPSEPATVRVAATEVSLDVTVRLEPLLAGLRAATGADVTELLGASQAMQIAPPGGLRIRLAEVR